jgi:3-oxoacyl-[acyl-carrier-protein] synthase II
MKLNRAVITGIGAVTPVGNNATDFWDALINGTNGVGLITHFDTSKFKTRFACEVKNFHPEDHFEKKEARKLDLFTQYALIAATEALKDSEINLQHTDAHRIGVVWGSGIGGLNSLYEETVAFALSDGIPRFNPFMITKMIADIAAGQISIKFNLRGPNYTTTSACASSAHAISDAYNLIRLGKADAVISGGSEAAVNPLGIGGFNSMHALSTRNDDFLTSSRPFDRDRDGFVMGEGAGALLLENLDHALQRGAKIYAEVAGAGLTGDAYHITAPIPDGEGAYMSMKSALEDAGLPLTEVDYINTHGTSTYPGDIAEIKAIKNLFGEHVYSMNINSTKSMTGHLLGAAGAIEAIASVLSIKDGIIHPTINHFNDDPQIDNQINFTFHKAQKRTVNVAVSNAFGFGGHNVSLVFKKFFE